MGFLNEQIERIYDLKGSTFNREVLGNNNNSNNKKINLTSDNRYVN